MLGRVHIPALLVLFMALVPAMAAAQSSASRTALARKLFREGVQAAREGRWDAAAEAFDRSNELAPRPTSLLNLAGAQVQIGRLVEAAENYRRFLNQAESPSARGRIPVAEQELAELEPRVPHVRVLIEGLAPEDTLELDGKEIPSAVVGEDLPVNPGQHTLMVRREGVAPVLRSLELAEGQLEVVRIEMEMADRSHRTSTVPTPDEAAAEQAAADDVSSRTRLDAGEDSRPLRRSPALWVLVGAVVVGAVITGVLLAGSAGKGRFEGNIPPGHIRVD